MKSDRSLSPTPRTTLHRLRERGRLDRADLDAVLGAGLICHLGVVIDGTPVVLPTGYGRIGDLLYLHGSSANKSLLAAAGQRPASRSRCSTGWCALAPSSITR